MNIQVYLPPNNILRSYRTKMRIFLAGTIDMGASIDWQAEVIKALEQKYKEDAYPFVPAPGSGAVVYNPRRPDWNTDWEQDIDNPEFRRQVEWEHLALTQSTHILFNFLPDSMSPITLFELGLFAKSGKCHVVCPKEYYRSGNVHIMCELYGIPVYENVTQFLRTLE